MNRRTFSKLALNSALLGAASQASPLAALASSKPAVPFEIAVMTWSFHMPLWRGQLKAVELPGKIADLGVTQFEWSAKCLRDLKGGRETMFQAPSIKFFETLRQSADDAGVNSRVISLGGPFYLAGVNAKDRNAALDFFLQYVDGAKALGCDMLRVELYCNAPQGPDREAQAKDLAMTGLHALDSR